MTKDALLIYVHGAGDQGHKDAAQLKTEFDQALFGGAGPSEAVPWWQVFWERKDGPRKEAVLDEAIRELAQHPSTPEADAAALLAAIRRARPPVRRRGGGEEAVQAGGPDRAQEAIAGVLRLGQEPRRIRGDARVDLQDPGRQGVGRRGAVSLRRLGEADASAPGHPTPPDRQGPAPRGPRPQPRLDPRLRRRDRSRVRHVGRAALRDRRDTARDPERQGKGPRWAGPGPMPPATKGWQNFHDSRDKVGWFGETLAGKYPDRPR